MNGFEVVVVVVRNLGENMKGGLQSVVVDMRNALLQRNAFNIESWRG